MEHVHVATRLKPVQQTDIAWEVCSSSVLRSQTKLFCVQNAYGSTATTQQIFDEMVESKVWAAMEGENSTVLVYGAKGSGKSYTVYGDSDMPGILHFISQTIFSYVEQTPQCDFLIRCWHIQIKNELFDLLCLENSNFSVPQQVTLIQKTEFHGVTEKIVDSLSKLQEVIQQSIPKKTNGHSLFHITIENKFKTDSSVNVGGVTVVDFGDQDEVKNMKDILAFKAMINHVSLNKQLAGPPQTLLCQFLAADFEGYSNVTLICTLNPRSAKYSESFQSLILAEQAKKIYIPKQVYQNPYSFFKYNTEESESLQKVLTEIETVLAEYPLSLSQFEAKETQKYQIEQRLKVLQQQIVNAQKLKPDASNRRSERLQLRRSLNFMNSSEFQDEQNQLDLLSLVYRYSRVSPQRMSIPQEPGANTLANFYTKENKEVFASGRVSLPNSQWLKILLEQENTIKELRVLVATKNREIEQLREALEKFSWTTEIQM